MPNAIWSRLWLIPNSGMQRIPSLEAGIYAVGRLEFAELFSNEEETRPVSSSSKPKFSSGKSRHPWDFRVVGGSAATRRLPGI